MKIKVNLKKIFVLSVFVFFFDAFAQNSKAKSAVELYNSARKFQEQDDYFLALELYKEALDLNPQYGDAWYNLAQCSYCLGNYDLAISYAENAALYSPNMSDIQNLRGMALVSLGRFDEAKEVFNSVLEKFPNDINSRFGLAELNLYEGKISGAQGLYEEALRRDSTNSKALLSLALISSENGNYNAAENYLNQAFLYHSGDPQVHYLSAYLASRNGNLKDAELRAKSAVLVDGNYDKAYALLAQILYAEKRYADVIDFCEYRISKNRNLSDAWHLLGLAQEKLNKKDDAILSFEAGLSVNPEDEVLRLALEQLVSSYVDLEDERRNDWASYHAQKALEYEKIYDGPSERFEYQKALSIAPYNLEFRQSFADLLERENLYESYLEQLKFIKESKNSSFAAATENQIQRDENSPSVSSVKKSAAEIKNADVMEALESMLKNNLSAKWSVQPFYLDKCRWKIGIYFKERPVQFLHAGLEEIIAKSTKDIFEGIPQTSVDVKSDAVSGYGEAFKAARKNHQDYFVILNCQETERSFEINAEIYSARTGTLTSSLHIYRTGNNKVAKSLRYFRQSILGMLPIRGKILKNSSGTLLIDLGKNDGISLNAEFDVVKKGSILTNDKGPGIFYKDSDLLGKFIVKNVNEELSEGEYTKKGFYDTMNIGDEVVLVRQNDSDDSESLAEDTRPAANTLGNPATAQAINEQKQNLAEDLKSHLEETELLRLIKNIK